MVDPLAAYNFDETGNVVVNFGTASGADFSIAGASVSRVAGHTGSGLRSTGSAPAQLPAVGTTTLRTIMAWLDFTGIPTSWPLQYNVPSIDSGGWGILYLAPNIAIQGRNTTTLARAQVAWPGGAHHVAGTYDGSAIRLYLDGALQGDPVALTGPLRTDTDPPALWVGTGAMASGYIDDVRIYDAVLTDAEIVAAMNTPVTDLTEETPPPTTPEPIETGGWLALLETRRWNTAAAERERNARPVACPHHGEPLQERDGILNCPWGDYRRE